MTPEEVADALETTHKSLRAKLGVLDYLLIITDEVMNDIRAERERADRLIAMARGLRGPH